MSKRHTTSRRRNYGRRQHELHERIDRRSERRTERDWRAGQELDLAIPYLDAPSNEGPFGFAD